MMIGDGLKREEIEQVIDENELHDKIIFLGEKKYNEIPDLYTRNTRKGDIFLIIYNYFF
jgi:glycosyltransferase involved in cell wall biosynthesis